MLWRAAPDGLIAAEQPHDQHDQQRSLAEAGASGHAAAPDVADVRG